MSTTSALQISNGEANPAGTESQRPVFVLFTSHERTLKALHRAGELAEHIGGRVVIVAIQVVPFPLPLDEAAAPMEFVLKRFAETAGNVCPNISIVAYLCRDRLEALKQILSPNTPILIGIRKRWWRTHDKNTAHALHHAGFAVVAVETE